MICDVVLSKERDKYIAKVKEWPEITAKDKMRDKVSRLNIIPQCRVNIIPHLY